MKSLILAEKPSVARDIAEAMNVKGKRNGYIENEKYVVTWALGHLVTNAQPEHYDKAYKGNLKIYLSYRNTCKQ